MRVLVTGGTGFVGSNLVCRLLEDGHEVIITGNDGEQRIPGFAGKFLHPSFVGLHWDAIGSVDVVFHQAAINNTVFLDRNEMFRANVQSTEQLLQETAKRGCRKFVLASSTAIYGNQPVPYRETDSPAPLNPYGDSKLQMEKSAMEFAARTGVTVVALRYCNVYGPGESHKGTRASMIYQLAQQMAKGEPRLFRSGEQQRDYVYVKDAVSANLLAAQATESCVVNCGSGVSTSFNDVVTILNKCLGLKRVPQYIDNPYQAQYQSHTLCDMSLAKAKIGFTPQFTIAAGISDYLASGSLVTLPV